QIIDFSNYPHKLCFVYHITSLLLSKQQGVRLAAAFLFRFVLLSDHVQKDVNNIQNETNLPQTFFRKKTELRPIKIKTYHDFVYEKPSFSLLRFFSDVPIV
ncbi:MAG: hypothetical protein K2P51_04950, partial [Rhabdochlamydiaceae bacterium]|nr:hypothetical protein [Rhabdochlamydiaceae bacterium]